MKIHQRAFFSQLNVFSMCVKRLPRTGKVFVEAESNKCKTRLYTLNWWDSFFFTSVLCKSKLLLVISMCLFKFKRQDTMKYNEQITDLMRYNSMPMRCECEANLHVFLWLCECLVLLTMSIVLFLPFQWWLSVARFKDNWLRWIQIYSVCRQR